MRLKVAVLQLAPVLGQPEQSMAKADELLSRFTREHGIQLLVLPELAFTGYTFADRNAIRPLMEEGGTGPTGTWCAKHAQRLNCTVACGYPRREVDPATSAERMYNSMLIVGPDGSVLKMYDKHHLYITDKSWADEGAEFTSFELPHLNGLKVGLGICMDINPYEFQAPFSACEFARFHQASKSDIIIFSSAWCNCHPDDAPETKAIPPDARSTVDYWITRLEPLLRKPVHFICADRVGKEPLTPIGKQGHTTFCGCSCVINLEEPKLLGLLDTKTEGVLTSEIEIADK